MPSSSPCTTIVGGEKCNAGGTGIQEITSADGTVVVTDPTGPVTDLSAPDVGDLTGITSADGSVNVTSPGGPVPDLAVAHDDVLELAPAQTNAPGVSTASARADHSHGVPVDTPSALEVGQGTAMGVNGTFSHSDHGHQVARGLPVATGTANAAGTGTDFVGEDHVHQTALVIQDEAAPQGDCHTVNFVGAAVSAAVVGNVATVTVTAAALGANPGNVQPNNVNAPGVATDAARTDHVHALPTGTPVSTGTANSAGTANAAARSDHVHALALGIEDEGVDQGDVHRVNFTGAGVTAAVVGGEATVNIPGGGGGSTSFVSAESNGTAAIGSASWTLVTSMSVVVPAVAGTYVIAFNSDCLAPLGSDFRLRITVGGVLLFASERECEGLNDRWPATILNYEVLAGGETVEVEVQRQSGFGSMTFNDRSLSCYKVA